MKGVTTNATQYGYMTVSRDYYLWRV